MRKYRVHGVAALFAVFALIAAACSNDTTSAATGGTSGSTGTGVCASVDTSGTDALATICKDGSIRVATDQKYKPQSWYDVKDGEWKGFDVDVARRSRPGWVSRPTSTTRTGTRSRPDHGTTAGT
jgi:ABC-type amino acid transport substrate-binding protein